MLLLAPENIVADLSWWEKIWNKFVDFVPTIITAVVVFVVGIIFTKILVKITGKALSKSKLDITAHAFLKSLIKIVFYTLAAVIALSVLGVPMSSIVAVIGAAGLAVGLALQNSLSNLAGGFIILFSKPFSAGDFIETNGVTGKVESINILYTKLLTSDNKAVFIPNGQVSNAKIINFTQEKLRKLELSFSISYDNDYEKAMSIIREVINKNNLALKDPEPFIRMGGQVPNGISIEVKVWVASENYFELNFDLLEEVKKAFNENGIKFPTIPVSGV
ncbi:MAG: Small-conductance mechanosensitive channel [Oscillospiraceae bacterium]|jgi:small conductance mechanosensitive channel|nr:Small-conductance mechanosensitive channel [Oscillospiraceae bacterium]